MITKEHQHYARKAFNDTRKEIDRFFEGETAISERAILNLFDLQLSFFSSLLAFDLICTEQAHFLAQQTGDYLKAKIEQFDNNGGTIL